MFKAVQSRASIDEELPDVADEEQETEEDETSLGLKVGDLFVMKQKGELSTHASRARLRFTRKESLFSLFLEPARDYEEGTYGHFYTKQGATLQYEYASAAKDDRISRLKGVDKNLKKSSIYQKNQLNKPLPTAWGLMYPLLDIKHQEIIQNWQEKDKAILENFSNYLQKGWVYASPVMIELYCWFIEFEREDKTDNAQDRYLAFVDFIMHRLKGSLMLVYFKRALETFESMCQKIAGHKLTDWQKNWDTLTGLTNPAWYASGQSGNRNRLILGFNSPFYPNVLVATSVFQEGVNLHLQCSKVHHYGIAWNPGDNEQRVGRVDRLFGQVNERLAQAKEATLDIHYPYLAKSFDEDQVGSFIRKKCSVEDKMDACMAGDFEREIELEPSTTDWHEFLRKPSSGSKSFTDPYQAKFDEEKCKARRYQPASVHAESNVVAYLKGLFSSFLGGDKGLYEVTENSHNPNAIFLIDPVLEQEGSGHRHQPILVERHFSSEFSALVNGTVYFISLKTPIASKDTLDVNNSDRLSRALAFSQSYESQCPLVQLAIDDDFANSHFYCHMKVDLPLFVKDDKLTMLSAGEVRLGFEQLKQCADQLEQAVFDDEHRDLVKEDLIINRNIKPTRFEGTTSMENSPSSLRRGWRVHVGTLGKVAQLTKSVTYQTLCRILDCKPKKEISDLSLLKLNAKMPFLTFSRSPQNRKKYVATLNYPSIDFQEDEQELLERWFKYCLT